MSHPDPYGNAEPRGWDHPGPLPWPETDLEPGPWRPGAEAYARPPVRPAADPYARPADRHDGPRGRRPYDGPPGPERGWHEEPAPGGPGRLDAGRGHRDAGSGGFRPADRDPWDHDPRDRGPAVDPRERYDATPRGRGYDRPDDEYPTAQIAPVRDEPTTQLPAVRDEPGPDPEAPATRRSKGRRRASADRPPTAQPKSSRAGRNLPAAIGVGLALGAAIVVPLFFYLPAFLAVIAAAVAIGCWEMARAVRRSGAHPPLVPLMAGGVITIGLAWFAGPDALCLGLLVTVLGTMIWRLGDGPGNYQRDLTAATLIAVYVPFLGGFAAMLAAAPDDGHLRVLVTLVAVVLSDTGGYAAGVAFGKHPMAPTISPKKSWEGFGGSVTAAAAGSALLLWLLLDVAPWWGALFGVAISGAAVLGDLAESMIKRDLGVKDMSNLLPGHGGLMDRLDSILFAVPTAYLLLAVFVPMAG
ncbi:phosphatidate cytidylyltransferase [Micromonospora chaiyaphumensis]|uniref:Phosphatidate cytidylyltransferase n=1 Tax=Micromonospora chaiyaphumensis TaxID=307119 RepID=A0A1C4YWW1_9ACTN|nr:phosphatidate cytidylyltransferase [Micromonospora chaiyaphumensis]SCF25116.1 phosphatidate cytidylyltransferase [Micromonospora chaiyaphumensis]